MVLLTDCWGAWCTSFNGGLGRDGSAAGLRLVHDVARRVDESGLAERAPDLPALGGEEGVGHAAADDQRIGEREQIAEKIELGRHLGAADHRRKRPARIGQRR